MQASRNGYFVVVDRTNGKNLLSVPYGPVNWSLGVDKNGNPIPILRRSLRLTAN